MRLLVVEAVAPGKDKISGYQVVLRTVEGEVPAAMVRSEFIVRPFLRPMQDSDQVAERKVQANAYAATLGRLLEIEVQFA